MSIWLAIYLIGVLYCAVVTVTGIKRDQDSGDADYKNMMAMAPSTTAVAIMFTLFIIFWPLTLAAALIYWWSNAD